jgi:uncharacterized protein YgiM (DUF1202 family)
MADVRNGPTPSSRIIGKAHTGAVAQVLAHDSGWVQIRDPASSNTGWISSDAVVSVGERTETQAAASEQNEASGEAEQSSPARHIADKHRHGSSSKRHFRHHRVWIGRWGLIFR